MSAVPNFSAGWTETRFKTKLWRWNHPAGFWRSYRKAPLQARTLHNLRPFPIVKYLSHRLTSQSDHLPVPVCRDVAESQHYGCIRVNFFKTVPCTVKRPRGFQGLPMGNKQEERKENKKIIIKWPKSSKMELLKYNFFFARAKARLPAAARERRPHSSERRTSSLAGLQNSETLMGSVKKKCVCYVPYQRYTYS